MTPERSRRAGQLLHEALALPAEERIGFVARACGADTALRSEVERLLAVPGPAARELPPHTMVGHYRIEERLGTGGMGVVYRAFDTRLGRPVALKFLHPDKAVTSDRKRRFTQEAKAASALNHPGIVTIYDVGEWEGSDYIAMELVEGHTLHHLIRVSGKLPPRDAMKYGVEIADAMSAAHEAGILHRDLKPGNIMITRRGHAKILDFGLAKLLEPARPPERPGAAAVQETETLLDTSSQTEAGLILGSPAYMSPEQAVGKTVLDARSDIFSLGSILHEMLCGRPAFRGSGSVEILAGILHLEAPAPSTLVAGIPGALDWVVARCLRKDPARRFQSMTELRSALEDVRGENAWTSSSATGSGIGASAAVSQTGSNGAAAAASTPPSRWLPSAAAAALAGGLVVIAAAVFYFRAPAPKPPPLLRRLTTEAGVSIDPSISRDGKLLVYASDRSGEGNLDIWLRQIGGGEPIRLTHHAADDSEPSFSPDGTRVVFRSERDGGGVYSVSALGGDERLIGPGGRRPRYSPDGVRIAYWTGTGTALPLVVADNSKIFVADADGSNPRQLASGFAAATRPVWSPDGRRVLFVGLRDASNSETYDWWVAPAAGGGAAEAWDVVTARQGFEPAEWVGDRIVCLIHGTEGTQIGAVSINGRTGKPNGPPSRLTTGTSVENGPSLSASSQLVFSSIYSNVDVYFLPFEKGGSPRRITKETAREFMRSVSTNGVRAVFSSDRSGSREILGLDIASGRISEVTRSAPGGLGKIAMEISPDGRQVAFREDNNRSGAIYVVPFEGGPARRLCDPCGQASLVWTRAGGRILFRDPGPPGRIRAVEVATGTIVDLLSHPTADLWPRDVSADGNWLAFTAQPHSTTGGASHLYLTPFGGAGPSSRESDWIEIRRDTTSQGAAAFSQDGDTLYYESERDGYSCLWAQRLDPATRRPSGEPFAAIHLHSPASLLGTPKLNVRPAIVRGGILASLEERSATIWMLDGI